MTNSKSNKTTLKKGDNLPPRGKTERTKLLEAMKRVGETEEGFYDLLVTKAVNPEDSFTFKELLIRLSPVPKAVAPTIKFDFPDNGTPYQKADAVMKAVSQELIPPDIGSSFVHAIKSMIEIEEHTELKDRIAKIEKTLGV